jgi:hypothetical protein
MPFRVFGGTARRIVSPRSGGPLSDWQLVESLTCRSSLVSGSRLPLCRWPNFLGFAVFPRRTSLKTVRFSAVPLCEFCFRVGLRPVPPSFTQCQRRCRSSSHGLSLPYSTCSQEGPRTRVLPARYVPPAGFGYPLGGLLPSRPCRLCFAPAALLGRTPSERSPHRGRPGRFRPSKLTYRFIQRFLRRRKAPARPDGSRFLSLYPQASPLRPDVCLIHQSPEAPLGFALLGFTRDRLLPDFAGRPLACLADTARKPPPAPQSIDQQPPGSIHSRHKA